MSLLSRKWIYHISSVLFVRFPPFIPSILFRLRCLSVVSYFKQVKSRWQRLNKQYNELLAYETEPIPLSGLPKESGAKVTQSASVLWASIYKTMLGGTTKSQRIAHSQTNLPTLDRSSVLSAC